MPVEYDALENVMKVLKSAKIVDVEVEPCEKDMFEYHWVIFKLLLDNGLAVELLIFDDEAMRITKWKKDVEQKIPEWLEEYLKAVEEKHGIKPVSVFYVNNEYFEDMWFVVFDFNSWDQWGEVAKEKVKLCKHPGKVSVIPQSMKKVLGLKR